MYHTYLLGSNPFFEAYSRSDYLGKAIFLALITLSIVSWIIILHKSWLARRVREKSEGFHETFRQQQQQPLNLDVQAQQDDEVPHPFLHLYQVLKKHTLEILNKNRRFSQNTDNALPNGSSFMSPTDIDLVESHLATTITSQTKHLEGNLFILSTIVTLAQFLGLLGTVWGILTTFSELQAHATGNTSQMVLNGLSLALATTVLGLIDAIPALIGYNYLKNVIKNFRTEMEGFANEILATIELHYRQVDVR